MDNSKIIVALDAIDREQALKLAETLSGHVWGFKVNDMLVRYGISIIEDLKSFGNVFADPKLHDIPNTIANSVKRLSDAGADLITIHASSGSEAIKAAVKNRGDASILCITALTSLDIKDIRLIFGTDVNEIVAGLNHKKIDLTSLQIKDIESVIGTSARQVVSKFAKLAHENGAQGVVCSAHELEYVRGIPNFLRVTPGIRLGEVDDDQKRVANPGTAIVNGSSFLVIGRPITQADEPLKVVQQINSIVRHIQVDILKQG